MSISSNNSMSNPASKFIEWRGGKDSGGVFTYYDKAKGENVSLPKKFQIVVLDQLSVIKGWHDGSQSGITSNEVRSTKNDELVVRSFKGGEIVRGLYNDIMGRLEGGKYTKSVYALLLSKNAAPELVNFQLNGSAIGSWIDAKIKDGALVTCATNPTLQKKGATQYYQPEFTVAVLPDGEVKDEAIRIDAEVLQPYLNQYVSQKVSQETTQQVVAQSEPQTIKHVPLTDEDDSDDLPF